MRIKITFYEKFPEHPEIGDACYWPDYPEALLSQQYLNETKKLRPPICVITPVGHFVIDSQHWKDGKLLGTAWNVSGDKENIHMIPSIQLGESGKVGSWHGYIQNGEMLE